MNNEKKTEPVVISDVPAGEQDDFPKFLAGNIEVIDPLDGPTDSIWLFEFKAEWANGSHRFFIWRIPGTRDKAIEVRYRLGEKAKPLGIVRILIYAVLKPCTVDMFIYIKMLNKTRPWRQTI